MFVSTAAEESAKCYGDASVALSQCSVVPLLIDLPKILRARATHVTRRSCAISQYGGVHRCRWCARRGPAKMGTSREAYRSFITQPDGAVYSIGAAANEGDEG